ncbi:hypothetical protein GCM10010293_61930 [Streptomyces griseoflavus]|nr:hypothetical protein GCM10010293_61930 [Streptomyces griseoflavus]
MPPTPPAPMRAAWFPDDAKAIDGVLLEAETDVGVDRGGDADVGVAEEQPIPLPSGQAGAGRML